MDALRDRPGVTSRMFSAVNESHDGPGSLLLSGRDEDITLAATMLSSSEGERMSEMLSRAFRWIGAQMRQGEATEIWLMLDSVDSGIDLPTIRMVKGVIRDVTEDVAKDGTDLFVLMSANGYAIAEGERCTDVTTGRRMSFGSWDEYAEFCLASADAKDGRYQRMATEGR